MSGYKDDRLKDYIEVWERVLQFYERWPDGRIQTELVELPNYDGKARVCVKAYAYRTAEDALPGTDFSWMELPGNTPYTRGSELENTSTSAIGRAIAATGIGIRRGYASRNEVDAKEQRPIGEHDTPPDRPELERDANGLIGTVEVGKPPVDMEFRWQPDGTGAWGFKLKNGRKAYQVLARGQLAEALATVGADLAGQRVTVWGAIEMIDWHKGDRDMPPFPRVNLTRIQTPEWTLPALPAGGVDEAVTGPEATKGLHELRSDPDAIAAPVEAPSAELFALDEAERTAVAGGLA